jgi:hypothetical protein
LDRKRIDFDWRASVAALAHDPVWTKETRNGRIEARLTQGMARDASRRSAQAAVVNQPT